MKKVVITGGAGFIGSQLGYALSQKNFEVTLVDNMSFGYEDNLSIGGARFGTFINKDIRDNDIIKTLIGADTVFHFAGISSLPYCQENPSVALSVNVAGTANILEAARRCGVRKFIFASTSAVYENNSITPFSEKDPISPTLIYSVSKQQAELVCKSFSECYGMDITIIRFFNVYGPHQDFRRKSPPLMGYICKQLFLGQTPRFYSNGEQKRDYIFIDDLIDLNLKCMTSSNAAGQTFNACSEKAVSVREIFDLFQYNLNTDLQPTFLPATSFWSDFGNIYEGIYKLRDDIVDKEVNKYSLGSYQHALQTLGWRPKVSLSEGVRSIANFVKTNSHVFSE